MSKICFDIGTCQFKYEYNSNFYVIPSYIACSENLRKVLAVGKDAKEMSGKTPNNIKVIDPIKKGVIYDYDATKLLIGSEVNRLGSKFNFISKIFGFIAIISVPSSTTEVEINALVDSFKSNGARSVFIIQESIASALGASIDLSAINAQMIVNIGGSITSISIVSAYGVVLNNIINLGGNDIDNEIVDYIKEKYNILIGNFSAEDLKKKVSQSSNIENLEATGRDIISGLPKKVIITANEINEACEKVLLKICVHINETIEKCTPEVSKDILENKIRLVGGGSYLIPIKKIFSNALKVKCIVEDSPDLIPVKGLYRLTKDLKLLKKLNIKDLILR